MSINYDLSKDFRFNQGIEQGISQGIEKGEHDLTKTLVCTSLAEGLTIEFIAKLIKKPVTYIQEIQKELEKEM